MFSARRLVIDEKCRPYPVAVVGPGHFRHHDGGAIDARVVLTSPAISLYCLDPTTREAIFVVVPADVDLVAAPFYYQAQYEAATGLIAVGFDTLHALADEAPGAGGLLLLYSVGRCGSTVVSRLLRETPGVSSLSEPDVYTQILVLRETGALTDVDVEALVRTCTRIICAPRGSGTRPIVAIKFRSFAIDLAAIFGRHFPSSRAVFLYRDAYGWAVSTMRAFGTPPEAPDAVQEAAQDRLGLLLPLLARYRHVRGRLLTPIEAMACHWAALMRGAQACQAAGAGMFALRYDDLLAVPREALAALYAYADLRLPAEGVVDAVLAADSQAGTALARDALDRSPRRQVDGAELSRVIADLESEQPGTPLTGDTVLSGTWQPIR